MCTQSMAIWHLRIGCFSLSAPGHGLHYRKPGALVTVPGHVTKPPALASLMHAHLGIAALVAPIWAVHAHPSLGREGGAEWGKRRAQCEG